jgi:hypothetical protein
VLETKIVTRIRKKLLAGVKEINIQLYTFILLKITLETLGFPVMVRRGTTRRSPGSGLMPQEMPRAIVQI